MPRKYEIESDKPADWEEDVRYTRNADGTITAVKEGDKDASDDKAGR